MQISGKDRAAGRGGHTSGHAAYSIHAKDINVESLDFPNKRSTKLTKPGTLQNTLYQSPDL
jgi:hypothetical protein